ncbi:hypothetical protein ACW6GR_002380 [Klebsiella michiganensis]
MGAAPVQAIADCLSRSGWKPEDVDHLESNEAFAAQALAVAAHVPRQFFWYKEGQRPRHH